MDSGIAINQPQPKQQRTLNPERAKLQQRLGDLSAQGFSGSHPDVVSVLSELARTTKYL